MKETRLVYRIFLSLIIVGYTASALGKARPMNDTQSVTLAYDDAARMAEMFERMLSRAPRFDAPDLSDPEFASLGSGVTDSDLAFIRRIVCLIEEQLEECCSTIDHIDCGVGDKCDSAIDFPSESVTTDEVNDTKASVISWLKTIFKDLRGLVNQGGEEVL